MLIIEEKDLIKVIGTDPDPKKVVFIKPSKVVYIRLREASNEGRAVRCRSKLTIKVKNKYGIDKEIYIYSFYPKRLLKIVSSVLKYRDDILLPQ